MTFGEAFSLLGARENEVESILRSPRGMEPVEFFGKKIFVVNLAPAAHTVPGFANLRFPYPRQNPIVLP